MGRQRPLKEVLREQKRTLTKAVRELEREVAQLQQAEKKLTADIKKAAKENQMVKSLNGLLCLLLVVCWSV